jgi:hypothetical protein
MKFFNFNSDDFNETLRWVGAGFGHLRAFGVGGYNSVRERVGGFVYIKRCLIT